MVTPKSGQTNSGFESRRKLLQFGACGAMTSTSFLSTLLHLKLTNAVVNAAPAVSPTGGYKALVCLFLDGGADSFNFLTPFGTTQSDPYYANYRATRGAGAMRRSAAWDGAWSDFDYGYLNPIVDSAAAGGTGRTFGLQPRFQYLKQMYDAGHATVIANAGALVEPIASVSEFENASKIKPLGLYSHSDQQLHWQTAVPNSREQLKGWAGRMADLLTDPSSAAATGNIYSAISTNGQSLLLSGNRIQPYAISPYGAVELYGIGNDSVIDRVYSDVHADLANQTYSDLLEKSIRNSRVVARDAAAAFQQAFSTTTLPSTGVQFPSSYFGMNLSAVAKAIKIAQSSSAPLHQKRQVFFVSSYGWDHHSNMLGAMHEGVEEVDVGLKAFYDFLIAENLLNQVTTFSISEFGRTWTINGDGTDHAWGGNPIVMGGAVNATPGNNRIWGSYPDIVSTNTGPTGLDLGRGSIIPQISADAYHAEICRWFGIGNDSNLEWVLPNIRNFYSQSQSGHPVGFLNY
jgi:uncharacterized protein (DUF1501 family)